ncbi:MAG: response regulator transcription factor [Clostridiales bacterium]|nr:response regulator transcription factor [Clostridiales bacterium]
MYNILVCDDEEDIVTALKIYLKAEGYNVICTYNGKQALDVLRREDVQLVLMDIMMPEMDGITAMSRLREFSNVPVILLTAKGEDADKVLGLNIGADDYVTKPFHPAELTARVKSQLRRYTMLGSIAPANASRIVCGGIELDIEERVASVDGEPITLTPTEYSILKLLMESQGKVFSTNDIYTAIWGQSAGAAVGTANNVAVHIRHLREKLEIDPAEPRYLKVVWGKGYMIENTTR